jgi:hypothetical protein
MAKARHSKHAWADLDRVLSGRAVRAALAALLAGALAGCVGSGSSSTASGSAGGSPSAGSTLYNLFYYGGTTVPPSRAVEDEYFDCPSVEILDGTAALRQEAGGAVRYQLSLGQTARECRVQGSQVVLKIGVEGRALLGQAGSPGTFTVPVRFVIKRGDQVLLSRLQRQSVTIPANDTQAPFAMVEENIAVPKEGDGDLRILVGFDGAAKPEPRVPRGRPRV